ncbi:D-aminoacyl-tRNA deacylase [Carboxydochorda subterranea]|uniref:D-aminoacyl-tRNA deacylase n=1 Tax=Carboxydichorda subterranea TaxID=3109565 RepID=A0ABZ1C017_9FIRM|nr:D-aminoacyl-tRNA deacylase [Limnochorda sp. L945t]WRP18299.1 D-aminoacyl-tRNA deacylase [Limnochorda sp. L945t]
MRVVVQRVKEARVMLEDGGVVASTGPGLVALVGVEHGDARPDAEWMAEKLAGLRIFEDDRGRLDRSVQEAGGSILLVSNFTVAGECRKGRRPSFERAAAREQARRVMEQLEEAVRRRGIPVATGRFGASMQVMLVNDGPVTLVVETPPKAVTAGAQLDGPSKGR